MEKFSAEEVYEIMTHISKGKVVTFGEIATLMGQPQKSAHVGCAMKGAFERGLPFGKGYLTNFVFCVVGAVTVLWIWKKLFD